MRNLGHFFQRMETYRLAQSLDKIKQKHQLSHQKVKPAIKFVIRLNCHKSNKIKKKFFLKLLKKMIELDHTKETYEKTQFYVKHRF